MILNRLHSHTSPEINFTLFSTKFALFTWFLFPRAILQTVSLSLSCSNLLTFTLQSALPISSSRFPPGSVFFLAISYTHSGCFSLQANDQFLLSCVFPCSRFHLIYGPTTTLLCTKIAFLYYFIQHSSFFEACCCFSFSADVLFNAAISFFLHVAPYIFWTCFKILSNLCSLLILPLLPFIFISLHNILSLSSGKKPDKMTCVSMPSRWFDILFSIANILHYKEAQVSHLLPILTVLLAPSHFLIFFALFLSFLLFPLTIKPPLSLKPLNL